MCGMYTCYKQRYLLLSVFHFIIFIIYLELSYSRTSDKGTDESLCVSIIPEEFCT